MSEFSADSEALELSGEDSFLDIVANIVGILILLVVVVGVRASQLASNQDPPTTPEVQLSEKAPSQNDELDDVIQKVLHSHEDVQSMVKKVLSMRQESAFAEQERMELQTLVTAIERELAEQRAKLDAEERKDYDVRVQLGEAQKTLDELTRRQASLVVEQPEVTELKHVLTPVSHKAHDELIHLFVHNGRVATIPVEIIKDEFISEVENNLWRLERDGEFAGTIGPFYGFRGRYEIGRRVVHQQTPNGTIERTIGIRDELTIFPDVEDLGETLSEVLLPTSDLMTRLATTPRSTSILLWTYPDSILEHQQLKTKLHELGFHVAVWPRGHGEPIGFSSSGSKARVQ